MAPLTKRSAQALVDRRIEQAIKLLQRANEGRYFADPSNRKKLHDPPFVPLLTGNAAFQELLQAVEKVPSEVPSAGPAAATR